MATLMVAVQPPSSTCTGMTLFPPVAARLQSLVRIFDQLKGYWAAATLVRSPDVILDYGLGGKLSDLAHPMPAALGEDRAYFYFPDFVILELGRYCIRISLLQMDSSSTDALEGVVIVRSFVNLNTNWIDVGNSPINETRPSKLLYRS